MARAITVGAPSGWRRFGNVALQPRAIVATIVLVLLGVLVVVPLGLMVLASFRPAGVLPLDAGAYTLGNYAEAFTDSDLGTILLNTFIYAAGGVVFAIPIAFGMAYLTERTDMPLRDWMYTLMFIPMSTPVFATALGWVLLAGPRAGTVNQWIRLLFGIDTNEGPFNIFSMQGLIFVHVLGVVPSMWLFLTSVLRNMDPSLEEAASASGASRWTTLRRVTAPLMAPGLLAIVIYFFISGIESLEHPLALGPTAGIETLSTKIFFTLLPTSEQGVNYGLPAAFGMLGLVFGVAGMGTYLWLMRRSSKYAVVSGKAYRPKTIRLGKWRYVALGLVGLFIFFKVVLPFSMLLLASFLKFYVPAVPKSFGTMVWTLDNYARLIDYRFFGRFFINSIIVSAGAAFITMLLVTVISWLVVRFPSTLSRFVNVVAFMPLAIPGVISTLAFFLMFIGTPIYGTLLLLMLAFTARFLAFGTRLMHSAQVQIHKELEEASLVSGIGLAPTFLWINLRLLLPAFLNGFLWVLVHAAKDFSVALLLATSGTLLIGNVFYGAFTGGRYPSAAAMMVVLIAFNLVVVMLGRRWISRTARDH